MGIYIFYVYENTSLTYKDLQWSEPSDPATDSECVPQFAGNSVQSAAVRLLSPGTSDATFSRNRPSARDGGWA